jgi:ABC-type xylose transport system permease subunit
VSGSIGGAILGAFLLATIDNGMSLLGVPSYAQNVVKAIILVLPSRWTATSVAAMATRDRGDAGP